MGLTSELLIEFLERGGDQKIKELIVSSQPGTAMVIFTQEPGKSLFTCIYNCSHNPVLCLIICHN